MRNLTLSQLITLLEKVLAGDVELASFSAKKVDQYFEVETQFKGNHELPLETSEAELLSTPEPKLTVGESLSKTTGKPKFFRGDTHHFEEAVVSLEAFSAVNGHFKAKVVSDEKKLAGARPITLVPERGFEDKRLLAIACAEQVEVMVDIFNTEESGRYVYFLKNASIPQIDLFNDLINYLGVRLKSRC